MRNRAVLALLCAISTAALASSQQLNSPPASQAESLVVEGNWLAHGGLCPELSG